MASPPMLYFGEECVCPVCLDEYRNPKLLACNHSLCEECLEKMVKSSKGEVIICPICRGETSLPAGGVLELPANVTIQKLMENSPARLAKNEIKRALKDLRVKISMLEELNEKIYHVLENEAKETKLQIHDTVENLVDIIRKQEKFLLQQVDELVIKEREGNPMFIVRNQSAHICQAIKNLLKRNDLGELLEKKEFVMRQLHETDQSVAALSNDERSICFEVPQFQGSKEFLQKVTGNLFGAVSQDTKIHSKPSLLQVAGVDCRVLKTGQSIARLKVPRTLERRFNPCALCTTHGGDIVVTDQGNHAILVYNDNGVFLNQIGTRGDKDGELECPTGAVPASNNQLVVADGCIFGNPARLQVFKKTGEFARGAVKLDENNQWFAQASEAPDDHVIITCRKISTDYEARVKVYSSQGIVKMSFGSEGSGKLTNPVKAIYLNGQFFVSDMDKEANICMIKVFSSKGKYLRKFAEGMLRRDTAERVYSSLIIAPDPKLNQVLAYNRTMKVIRCYKLDGSLAAHHNTISDISDMVVTQDRKLLVTRDANKCAVVDWGQT